MIVIGENCAEKKRKKNKRKLNGLGQNDLVSGSLVCLFFSSLHTHTSVLSVYGCMEFLWVMLTND